MKYDPIMCMMVEQRTNDEKPLSKMNVNELRDLAVSLGADKSKLYGTSRQALIVIIDKLKRQGTNDAASGYVISSRDSNTLDKAITTCDKTEFDPQDSRYIRKAIGNLKAANSLLGMINEGTVNKAKQNIANTISLLESID